MRSKLSSQILCKAASAESGRKYRDRRSNAARIRQGEWFFVPAPHARVEPLLVLRNEPIARGGGKPRVCEELYRFGGETVYVSPGAPNGLTDQQYRALSDGERNRWIWRVMRRNPKVYVRGLVRHIDHKTVVLYGWHEVLSNTENLSHASNAGSLMLLSSPSGRGRTTVLRKLHAEMGGGFVTGKDFIETSAARHPLFLEDTLYSAVIGSLKENQIVFVDDIDLIHDATSSCHFYPRGQYVETALLELSDAALREKKKLVVSTDGAIAQTFATRSFSASIGKYSVADYAAILGIFVGSEHAASLDAEKIYRFAPKLNAHQIRAACDWLRPSGPFSTDQFIEYLRSQRLASNVDLTKSRKLLFMTCRASMMSCAARKFISFCRSRMIP